MKDYTNLALDIIKNVGGKENVIFLTHCVTRLRFQLKDEAKANTEILKKMDGVITVMQAGGQYQVVIGNHVPDVYAAVCQKAGLAMEKKEEAPKEKTTLLRWVTSFIQAAMMPSISVMCASGMLKGILVILVQTGILTPQDGLYMLLYAAGDAYFYFMPAIIGFNVAKKLNMSQVTGIAIGLALCYPGITGVDLNLFGMTVNASYTASFLPVIFCLALAAPLEKKLNKIVPDVIKMFTVPLIVLALILPAGFVLIGPVANGIAGVLSSIFKSIFGFNEIIAGGIVCGLWQILIIFGMHAVIMVGAAIDFMSGNPSTMLAVVQYIGFTQMAVCFAVFLKTKDKKLKNTALPASISAIFGVTEPAIYGVTLPRMKLFVITCIGSAVSGMLAGVFHVKTYLMSGLGIFSLIGLINPQDPNVLGIILPLIVGSGLSFILALLFFRDEETGADVQPVQAEDAGTSQTAAKEHRKIVVKAPVRGRVKQLSELKDLAFSGGALGKGVAIVPEEGKIFAPFDGKVAAMYPTKHAIGLMSSTGCEILIHIGMDTVRLEGKHFKTYVKQDDEFSAGDLLVSFDKKALEKEGFTLDTPIVVTNTEEFLDVIATEQKTVETGDVLLTII